MLVIPVFNLVAPVVAIAFMVHLVTPRMWRTAGTAGRVVRRLQNTAGNRSLSDRSI
jgi:hypothetical protein